METVGRWACWGDLQLSLKRWQVGVLGGFAIVVETLAGGRAGGLSWKQLAGGRAGGICNYRGNSWQVGVLEGFAIFIVETLAGGPVLGGFLSRGKQL